MTVRKGHRRPHVEVRKSVKHHRGDLQAQKTVATQWGWATQDQEVHRGTHKRPGVWRGVFRKGKVVLVKGDVPRDDDPVGRQVKTAISFMMSGITKEDT
jgi:hypothetical protein